jgi:hypothetical protein
MKFWLDVYLLGYVKLVRVDEINGGESLNLIMIKVMFSYFVCNIHMAMIAHIVTILLILLLSFFLQCHKCILSKIIDNPMACKMEREKIPTTYQLLLALLVGLDVNM